MLSDEWNDHKAPDMFRANVSNKWGAGTVTHFEKFTNRSRYQKMILNYITTCIPEIKNGGYNILDMSCGSGMMLEIARDYGNEILGTNEPGHVYAPLLDSQNIPIRLLDGSKLPYSQFEDKSFDIVSSMHALFFFPNDMWFGIVQEMCRIARKIVFVVTSIEPRYSDINDSLSNFAISGWDRVVCHAHNSRLKWEYKGNGN